MIEIKNIVMEKINTTFLEKLKKYINIKGFWASDLQNIKYIP